MHVFLLDLFRYRKILVGESSDRIAIGALASTSKGRGFAVADDSQYITERFGGEHAHGFAVYVDVRLHVHPASATLRL